MTAPPRRTAAAVPGAAPRITRPRAAGVQAPAVDLHASVADGTDGSAGVPRRPRPPARWPALWLSVGACAGLWLGGAASLLAAPADAPSFAGGVYSCRDAAGHTITADRPIDSCAQREVRMLNPDGSVRRVIPAPPTADEQQAQRRRELAAKEAERAIAMQRTKDRTLLQQYDSEQVLQTRRQRMLAEVDAEITSSRERIRVLGQALQDARAQTRDWTAKNPAAAAAPRAMTERGADLENQILAEDARVQERVAERGRIDQRFDADLARLRTLLSGSGCAEGPAPAADSPCLRSPSSPAPPAH